MTLWKWQSNSRDLLAAVPDELKEKENIQLITAPRECHKALGVHWHTVEDTLHVAMPSLQPDDLPTKRQVASDVARTFDILGLFASPIVIIKLLLQKLWQLQLDWDQFVPDNIVQDWRTWREELPLLTDHAIPRCYYSRSKKCLSKQLHGFCDASQLAYAGVVYLQTVYTDNSTTISLVTSKTIQKLCQDACQCLILPTSLPPEP